jgi:hypothetical protein
MDASSCQESSSAAKVPAGEGMPISMNSGLGEHMNSAPHNRVDADATGCVQINLTPHNERCVAVKASVHPRTVRMRLRNLALPVKERSPQDSTTEARVDRALRDLGFWPATTSTDGPSGEVA